MINLIAIGVGFILMGISKDKFGEQFGWTLSDTRIIMLYGTYLNG
jgi:hypothetical protein